VRDCEEPGAWSHPLAPMSRRSRRRSICVALPWKCIFFLQNRHRSDIDEFGFKARSLLRWVS
jgi:hypothetical protein